MQAQRQQKMLRERATGFTEQAKFALAGNRDDLAEAAVWRQIDFETEADALEQAIVGADEEAKRLEQCMPALGDCEWLMEDEPRAFETAQRDAETTGADGSTLGKREIDRRVERAEAAFNRAMDGTGVAGVSRADAKTASALAELDTMQKSAVVASRRAALRKTA